ncbi:hypothetical protein BD770DRAFT_375760 [Pilaira anomala]|nr:hypothetical protein BD770DRAFT_375760 [Pilaira anomala]
MSKNREILPSIQLPPPIIHCYIAPSLPWQQEPNSHINLARSSPTKAEIRETARKTSHSAIEKRRREKMNDKIERLKCLIPSCNSQFPTTIQQPIHKLSVLQAAIDYIGELHHQLEISLPKDDPFLKENAFMQLNNNKKSNVQ